MISGKKYKTIFGLRVHRWKQTKTDLSIYIWNLDNNTIKLFLGEKFFPASKFRVINKLWNFHSKDYDNKKEKDWQYLQTSKECCKTENTAVYQEDDTFFLLHIFLFFCIPMFIFIFIHLFFYSVTIVL